MRGYPSYCVWDTELDEMASDKGLLLVFSSLTGEIACEKANEMTQKLNYLLFNYSHYVRTEDEADRLLEGLLKQETLKRGWTYNDGTESHPWVVRGVKT